MNTVAFGLIIQEEKKKKKYFQPLQSKTKGQQGTMAGPLCPTEALQPRGSFDALEFGKSLEPGSLQD